MAKARSYGDYLYKQKGSQNWSIRLQYPPEVRAKVSGRKRLEKSLGTPNRKEAEARAAPLIEEHKRLLWEADNRRNLRMGYHGIGTVYPLGTSFLEDGTRVVATPETAVLFNPDASFKGEVGNRQIKISFAFDPATRNPDGLIGTPKRTYKKDDDDGIIERYIAKLGLEKHGKDPTGDANAVRRTLADLKEVAKGKRIEDMKPSDVAALIAHLDDKRGLSSGRIRKLLSYLRAACNRELKKQDNPVITRNVFRDFEIEDEDDERERPPYTDADIAIIKANLDKFPAEQRLMLTWTLATGIRPGAIYKVQAEELEDRNGQQTRYVEINGDKGKYGRRCLPIPQSVLNSGLLPERIDGPLFKTPLKQFLVMINNRLAKIGVNVNDKTLYSARHRSRDRLRDMDAPDQIGRSIMGHARNDVHERYGHGFAMYRLKPWVDQIGF